MGLNHSHILLIGLPNSGKTHLLDFLTDEHAAGRPTDGIDERFYQFENYVFKFVEYGGSTDWETLLNWDKRHYRCIYMIIRGSNAEAQERLLKVADALKNVPIVVLWNQFRPSVGEFQYPTGRRICTCTLNFDNSVECLEKLYRIFKWTASVHSQLGV